MVICFSLPADNAFAAFAHGLVAGTGAGCKLIGGSTAYVNVKFDTR